MSDESEQVEWRTPMYKAVEWFCWGLCMGMGWAIAANVLNFIATFIHASH